MGQEHSSTSSYERRPQRPSQGPPQPPPKPKSAHPTSRGSISSGYTTSASRTASTTSRTPSNTSRTSSNVSRTPSSASRLQSNNPNSRTASNASEYKRPIYTNVHFKDLNNNDIYKPLKLSKNKIHGLKILNADKETAIYLEKHLSIKSYLDQDEVKKKNCGPQLPEPAVPKKACIRNYTPKILSEKDPKKDLEHWI